MKKLLTIVSIVILISVLMTTQVYAMTTTFEHSIELEAGTYTLHMIYRSESFWFTKEYDSEVITTFTTKEITTLRYCEDVGEYNYHYIFMGDKRDNNTNVYVYYNKYD